MERNKSFPVMVALLCFGAALWAVRCGSSGTTRPGPGACRDATDSGREERRPHFVTRQILGAPGEGATVLYRLDTSRMTAAPVVVRGSDSNDALALRFEGSGELMFLERFLGDRRSRLTRTSCDLGGSRREIGTLPPNTFGLGTTAKDRLVALGWNDGTLTSFSLDFATTEINNVAPSVVGSGFVALEKYDRHFNTLLVRGDRRYVVTTGYDLQEFRPTQAKVLELSKDLLSVVSVSEVTECYNAYQDYTLQVSSSQVVVGCNPQYRGDNGLPLRLVAVEIGDDAVLRTRVLAQPTDAEARIMIPGGLTQNREWLLVTEETVTAASSATASPGVFAGSYWLNLRTGDKSSMNTIGGRVIYDEVERAYVMSCAVNNRGEPCKSGGFVVLKAESWDQAQSAEWKPVKFDYDFYQFERPAF